MIRTRNHQESEINNPSRIEAVKAELTRIADEVYGKCPELPKDYDGHVLAGRGASGSATSKIDKFAEDAILEFLNDQEIRINVLSEEARFRSLSFFDRPSSP